MFKKNQNHRLVGGMQQQHGFNHSSKISPMYTNMRAIGPVASSWQSSNIFEGAMRNFGMNLGQRRVGAMLPHVGPQQNAAVIYHAGLRNSYNFLKNPRGADGDVMNNDSQGNINSVEKGLR